MSASRRLPTYGGHFLADVRPQLCCWSPGIEDRSRSPRNKDILLGQCDDLRIGRFRRVEEDVVELSPLFGSIRLQFDLAGASTVAEAEADTACLFGEDDRIPVNRDEDSKIPLAITNQDFLAILNDLHQFPISWCMDVYTILQNGK